MYEMNKPYLNRKHVGKQVLATLTTYMEARLKSATVGLNILLYEKQTRLINSK